MPAISNARDSLLAHGRSTIQHVATANTALRRALARLVSNGGRQRETEEPTR